MKGLVIAFTGLGLLGLGANVSSAKSAAGDSAPPPPPVHHSSSAPVTAPVGAAVSHNAMGGAAHNPAGTGSFRPTITAVTGSGQRTLVYPGVHNSIVRHPANTNLNAVKPGHNGAVTGSSKVGSQSGRG